MKLGFLLAGAAKASYSESFELIPDGFHGSYQNWNVTQLLVENEDDELFQAFEQEYHNIVNDHETKMFEYRTINKVKNLQNMILYMQDVPMFGKFFNYGCHCFPGGIEGLYAARDRKRAIIHAKPVDQADSVCRNHDRCHQCVRMDFSERCDIHKGYKFEARQDSVTQKKYIICLDKDNSCQRSQCECDKALAYDLSDKEYMWSLMNHRDWAIFDAESRCTVQEKKMPPLVKAELFENPNVRLKMGIKDIPEQSATVKTEPELSCCGSFPRRYPYHPDDGNGNIRKCCHSTPFDPFTKECCSDGTPRQFGQCP